MNPSRSWFYLVVVSGFCLTLLRPGIAQIYPDTLWIPVIFYDYRGLGTNGFQPPDNEHCNYPDYAGMVRDRLSVDFKPVRNRNVGCSQTLNEWYRPSGANGPATNTGFYFDTADSLWKWTNLVPYINPLFPNNRNEYVSSQYNANYHMSNIVIYDSLPFLYRPNLGEGVYQFSRTGQNGEPMFFWLDGKGYGEDPRGSGHNFYFTMELHWWFTYKPGLTFDFQGDDDVWAFVNDSLVMDLGGIHEPLSGSFRVDDFASRMGMVEGEKYPFRFFYAERKTEQSTIRITSNILAPQRIKGLNLTVQNTTIEAGRQLSIPAQLITEKDNRVIPADSINPVTNKPFYDEVKWLLLPITKLPGDTLSNVSGSSVTFSGTMAFRTRIIVATYVNPVDGTIFRDTARVTVMPGPDYKVWIDTTSRTPFASAADILPKTYRDSTDTNRAISLIRLDSAQQVAYAGAVVRDRYGNIKRVAGNGQWEALPSPPAAVTASPTSGRAWQGTITRIGFGIDSIQAWESSPTRLFGDTVRVEVAEPMPTDTIGPQIVRALFYLGTPPGVRREPGEPKARDTLIVTFDEPVRCVDIVNPAAGFNYIGQNPAALGQATLISPCDSLVDRAVFLVDSGLVRAVVDSLQIRSIRDRYGNLTQAGVKRQIEWGRSYDPVVKVIYNPFKTGVNGSPIQEFLADRVRPGQSTPLPVTGTAIRVELATTDKVLPEESFVVFYDAVGNQVTNELPALIDKDGSAMYMAWDGRNRNGRYVGSGTYLGIVRVKMADKTSTVRVKIGLRK